MKEVKLKTVEIPIKEIKGYENNSKKHPEWQINQIVDSIREFGFNDPIAVDENNVIIEGHGRYEALKKIGRTKATCIVLSHLSESQKKAYIIAHNKLTMNTGFDEEILKKELENLKIDEFDLATIGFTEKELEVQLGEVEVLEDEEPSQKVEFEIKKKKNAYKCPSCGEEHLKTEFEEVDI
ncbi:MAG: ParB N-terminal domain-containing protein [Cetobacterium sp.]